MTEQEWLESTHPTDLARWVKGVRRRKARLFACAICRSVWDELTAAPAKEAIEVGERHADGLAAAPELDRARNIAGRESMAIYALSEAIDGEWQQQLLEQGAALRAAWAAFGPNPTFQELIWHQGSTQELQCLLLRDLIGNPFRPVAIDRTWLTWNGGAIAKFAQSVYDNRAFSCLPMLGDALEEAGCDNLDILVHCRGEGPHVLGCWVVDLLLGKT